MTPMNYSRFSLNRLLPDAYLKASQSSVKDPYFAKIVNGFYDEALLRKQSTAKSKMLKVNNNETRAR